MRQSDYDRKIKNCAMRIIISIMLIFTSFFIFNYVFLKIINYPYLSNIRVKDNKPSISVVTDDGHTNDAVFISDEKGIRFRKEDSSFARDEWIEKNGELFYFDNTSYGKEGWMNLLGQSYYFEKGKLKIIQRDKKFSNYSKEDIFNSIDSTQYLVYLDEENRDNNDNYAVKYKKYEEDIEDYLGTSEDIQYSGEGLLNIYLNNVYYVTLRKNTNFGTLNRMRPNAERKEYIDARVYGYIVLSNDIVYYYNGNVILKAKTWLNKSVKFLNDESEIINTAIEVSSFDPNFGIVEPIISSTPRKITEEITPVGISTDSKIRSEVPNNYIDIEEPTEGDVVVGRAPGDLSSVNDIEERRSALPQIPIPNIFALPR